jgi:murein DD-endopeptidase MepM/ murein hydrolase activator NlpD
MRPALRVVLLALCPVSLALCPAESSALADVAGGAQAPSAGAQAGSGGAQAGSGGAQAPSAPLSGGSQFGVATKAAPAERPGPSTIGLPPTAPVGRPPRLLLRIEEPGVRTVYAKVTLTSLSGRARTLVVAIGWVHTGRTVAVRWPGELTLEPGAYRVILTARDHRGQTLSRSSQHPGETILTIRRARSVGRPAPAVAPAVAVTPPAGVPTPAESVADGAVFPVAGPHSFGGPENRFGAPRAGHVHQGQDVLSAEGTPVVAPLAGTILTTSYQAGGAGYYAVEHTGVGLDFMFAHCKAGSLAVVAGQDVAGGQTLCRVGQTGDATAPHLHFELWIGGWSAPGGSPIDPLPYLQAWESAGRAARASR